MLAPPVHPIPLANEGRSRAAWAIAVVLLAGLALVVLGLRGRPGAGDVRGSGGRPADAAARAIAARVPPPPVLPTVYADMTRDQARADNDARPIVAGKPMSLSRFVFAGSPADRVVARACLAAAVWYEAGDDRIGEQAVAQVVLNRLRHPAFPKTVCGVVFQGSERTTGCQFTFACDGSLARIPDPRAWERAMRIADAALSGSVYKDVGTATHYHTDWVVPYWRDSLTKIAKVGTHIFYRWSGWWGTPAAFGGRAQPLERIDPRIVALAGPGVAVAPAMAIPADLLDFMPAAPPPSARTSLSVDGVPASALKGSVVRLKDEATGQYVLQLDPDGFPGSWAIVGYTLCAAKPDCIVTGWTTEGDTPRDLPVSPVDMRSMAFMYRKSSAAGVAKPTWDCRRYARPVASQCVPGTAPARPAAAQPRRVQLPLAALKPVPDDAPATGVPETALKPPPAPASH